MRSVIENHVEDFLRILSYDKSEWKEFWKKMKRRFHPLLDEYERELGVSGGECLKSIRRMDLDRFRREWPDSKRDLKKRIGYELRSKSEEVKLNLEDFVVFLFSGMGKRDYVIVRGKKENVFMFDAFKFWMNGRLEELPSSILDAIRDFRESGRW